jgi:hypothetical protein
MMGIYQTFFVILLQSKALFNRFFTPSNPSSRYIRMDAATIGVKVAAMSVTGRLSTGSLIGKMVLSIQKGMEIGVNQFEEENR